MTSPAEAIRQAAVWLGDAGVATPAVDARLLLLHVTQTTPAALLGLRRLEASQLEQFHALIRRRAERVPLQHLTGKAFFRNVELSVGPGVFIPRPETESVAGAAIAEALRLRGPLVVELCAGSGAISAAVLDEVPGVRLVAIEREPDALVWLRQNLVGSAAEIIAADLREPQPQLAEQADVVVVNPPYVPLADLNDLDPEVRDHDPATALFAGADGLALMPDVIATARRLLRPGGLVVIEHGDEQADACLTLLAAGGFEAAESHRDLAGRPRYVTGRAVTGWKGGSDVER